MNTLFYGDNLPVLRRYVGDESVDLVYLDPPFKSDQDYNVLFAEQDGSRSAAQIKAFGDTWRWDQVSAAAYHETVEAGGRVSLAMQAFRQAIGENDMLAYLSMMAPRLVELRRVLKPNGSIYLHCDPTASHYLKMLMDAIFGPTNFRNEIIWKRTQAHNDPKRCGSVHDVILFYARDAKKCLWNGGLHAVSDEYMKSHYSKVDEHGRHYQLVVCHAPGPGPARNFFGKKMEPPEGRHWTWTQENIDKLFAEGRIVETKSGMPRLVQYAPDGVPLQDVWMDIDPLNSQAKERLGYPTQKPEALLERIIRAGSNEGDTILDPFCGCGTAIAVAERLRRRWVGIDITHLAVTLIKHRMKTAFGDTAKFEIVGEPTSLPDAKALAGSDPYQFQWWALGLVNARPAERKKGADKGIDGRIFFHDEWAKGGGQTKQIVLSVKAGHTSVSQVRDLRGVMDREKAPIGVLITMEEPTRPMREEAASAGFYKSPWSQEDHPRLQIVTIKELLGGKKIDAPPQRGPQFKAAPKARRKPTHRQKELDE